MCVRIFTAVTSLKGGWVLISVEEVRNALRPRFGTVLTEDPGFSEGAADLLRRFAPYRDTFASLTAQMEDYLFNALYDRLGPGMTLRLDDGQEHRFMTSDLPVAADEALFPLFDALTPYSVNYDRLHTYWMDTGSFSAMRALYLNFSDFLPPQEIGVIERIVQENVPVRLQNIWFGKE